MTAGFDDCTPALTDAWTAVHPGVPHAPTAGVHEKQMGQDTALLRYCCDFLFITPDLVPRVRRVEIDART
jgi:hypothetical protein